MKGGTGRDWAGVVACHAACPATGRGIDARDADWDHQIILCVKRDNSIKYYLIKSCTVILQSAQ